jgi:TRAP transporter TAXI family solute receptor
MAERTRVSLATATPGGGFPFFGDNAAAVINETDPSLDVVTQNTKGSTENIGLLNESKVDIALVAGEPAYEAFQGIGQGKTTALVIQAIYSNPGMFVVKGDSPAKTLRDLVGKPVAWGTRASGLTLLGRYVTDGLGLDREKDFQPHYLEKAGDGPLMVADGRVAALWGGGIGWPGFTAVASAGGRLLGPDADGIRRIQAKHSFLKTLTVPAGSYPGQPRPIVSVGSWSFIMARPSLSEDVVYRLAHALHTGAPALAARLPQAAETTAANTLAAVPSRELLHAGVLRHFRELGLT